MKKLLSRLGLHPSEPLAERVRREGLTYLSPQKLQRIEAELSRVSAGSVAGDFLEFGVALGGSAIVIATAARAAGRRFAGFDVFAMIPPPASEKDDDKSRRRYETIRTGQSKGIRGATYYGYLDDLHERVLASFARYGIPARGPEVRLVKGLFEDTWPEQDIPAVAFAHIDCDWYDPVRFCLNAVADRMSVGGSIVLDDYHDYGGCRTATEEFLSQRSDFVRVEGENLILRRTG